MSEYDEMTPHQLNIALSEYAKRKELERKQSIMQAYLISSWMWMKPHAKYRELRKLLSERKTKKVMSDEEMLERVKALNAMFGGEVVRR